MSHQVALSHPKTSKPTLTSLPERIYDPIDTILAKLINSSPEQISDASLSKNDFSLLLKTISSRNSQSRTKAMLVVAILLKTNPHYAKIIKKLTQFGEEVQDKYFLFTGYRTKQGVDLKNMAARKEPTHIKGPLFFSMALSKYPVGLIIPYSLKRIKQMLASKEVSKIPDPVFNIIWMGSTQPATVVYEGAPQLSDSALLGGSSLLGLPVKVTKTPKLSGGSRKNNKKMSGGVRDKKKKQVMLKPKKLRIKKNKKNLKNLKNGFFSDKNLEEKQNRLKLKSYKKTKNNFLFGFDDSAAMKNQKIVNQREIKSLVEIKQKPHNFSPSQNKPKKFQKKIKSPKDLPRRQSPPQPSLLLLKEDFCVSGTPNNSKDDERETSISVELDRSGVLGSKLINSNKELYHDNKPRIFVTKAKKGPKRSKNRYNGVRSLNYLPLQNKVGKGFRDSGTGFLKVAQRLHGSPKRFMKHHRREEGSKYDTSLNDAYKSNQGCNSQLTPSEPIRNLNSSTNVSKGQQFTSLAKKAKNKFFEKFQKEKKINKNKKERRLLSAQRGQRRFKIDQKNQYLKFRRSRSPQLRGKISGIDYRGNQSPKNMTFVMNRNNDLKSELGSPIKFVPVFKIKGRRRRRGGPTDPSELHQLPKKYNL